MAGGGHKRSSRGWMLALLAGLSALLLALLAVATNAAPERFKQWAEDPRSTWVTTDLLAVLVVITAIAFQRMSLSGSHSPAVTADAGFAVIADNLPHAAQFSH